MTFDQAYSIITELEKTIPKNKLFGYIEKNRKDLFDYIQNLYNWPVETKSSTKLYWAKNGITEVPSCIVCGKPVGINAINPRTGKYRLHCSHYCGCHSEHARNEYRNSCLRKYGVDHNMKCGRGIQEYSDGVKSVYGTEYTFQNEDIRGKIRKTVIKKYGVEFIGQSNEVKQKIGESKKQKTDADIDASTAKRRFTKFNRYGNENFVNPEKAKQTCMAKYGVECALQTKQTRENSIDAIRRKSYDSMMSCEYDTPVFSFEDYCRRTDDKQILDFKCAKCGKIFQASHHDGAHFHCPKCYPRKEHYEEKELVELVKHSGIQCVENCRDVIPPMELDLYIPSRRIAIEFDGLYWHSADISGRGKNYHLEKTEKCSRIGIHLIHVFESEWIMKKEIVIDRIMNMLGLSETVIFARKCSIQEIDCEQAAVFQTENHIQGPVNSKTRIGLFLENKLVALMTFGKCRFDKKHEWELLRFCCLRGHRVIGAAGRLLKYFEKKYKPKSLVTYADRRWSQGKLYNAIGFKFIHASPPNYWYWKDNYTLESRVKYQKHRLKNILPVFDDAKTEIQNMIDNGYHRIFDCGNLVFEKTYDVS